MKFCSLWCWSLVVLCLAWMPCASLAITLDCDPCIDRKQYLLKAILHGTDEEAFWLQVQSAMKQAALDAGVQLELELRRTFDSFEMAQEIEAASKNKMYNALIVTIPDAMVQEAVNVAIQERNTPVFGMNLGYEVAQELGIIGFAAQDETVAGTAAAQEFQRILSNSTTIDKALFVYNDPESNAGLDARYQGFKQALAPPVSLDSNTTNGITNRPTVEMIQVDPSDQFAHVTAIQNAFENCQYDVVLLGSSASLEVATSALESSGCLGQSLLATFDDTPEIHDEIVQGRLAFGVSEQPYLQAVLPVYFAAMYVTTGKALALPVHERVYLSGPTIINKDNVPTDTIQECEADAFPVCPNTLAPNGVDVATCACTDRSKIRIGGVLHGVTTDVFWDPVFAAAEQAASDMGIDMDLIRFEPSNVDEDIFRRMAARIKTLCEGGVDGIFVTIPSDTVVESIQRCLDLQVPVISVNAGGDKSEEMGLLNHIGMIEYNAGYGAAQRLIDAGMVKAYCFDHAPGNVVTEQRCQGFGDAIADFPGDVTYMGKFDVPLDNKAEYKLIVEAAVGQDGDWTGVGILLLGSSQVEPYRETLSEAHPGAYVGSFDLNEELYAGLDSGIFLFGIDQQPVLQGNMPVILLALVAYTKQSLKNHFVESGPDFVETAPSPESKICEANFFKVCPERPPEDMNFISPGILAFTYTLFGLLVFGAAVAAAWTFYYRAKWVVKISQPTFLYLMLCGIVLSSLSIPFLGVETEYRFVQDNASGQLTLVENASIHFVDAACMMVPWFYGLGFGVTFSAIFAKIQRVKLIYLAGINMQRKKVTIKDVMPIMIVMLGIEFVLLLSWQLVSPYRWHRTVTEREDGFPVESVGVCESDSGAWFFLAIILFHVICLIYALVLSWQTKDLNNEFAESSYLFLAVMFMFQIQCLAVPILALVQDSPDVFHFVQAIAIFSQNFVVLVLIFGPKMYKIFMGQADPSANYAAAGRTANPRTSLTRPNMDRRTDMQSHSKRRPSSSAFSADGGASERFDVSEQFVVNTPNVVTFSDNLLSRLDSDVKTTSSSSGAKNAPDEQYNGGVGSMPDSNSSSSYRHSQDLWSGQNSASNIEEQQQEDPVEEEQQQLQQQQVIQPRRNISINPNSIQEESAEDLESFDASSKSLNAPKSPSKEEYTSGEY